MVRKSIWVGMVVFCLACVLATPRASGQAVYGSIVGTVTDAQGAGVAAAKVTVTNLGKGTTEEVATNESGGYSATHLIPDNYKVRIEAAGFKAYEIASVRVDADTAVRADAQLQVGAVTQSVEVAGENPQGSQQIETNGQHFAGTAFELDGTDNQDPILGIIVINPNLDAIDET